MSEPHHWNVNITCPRCGHIGDAEVSLPCCDHAGALRAALEMVLMYHSGPPWDDVKAKRWRHWTGRDDSTTRAMCDQIRVVLSEGSK